MTSNGQITIPAALRSAVSIGTSDRVEFVSTKNGRFELVAAPESVRALKGIVARSKEPVRVEDMNAAIKKPE